MARTLRISDDGQTIEMVSGGDLVILAMRVDDACAALELAEARRQALAKPAEDAANYVRLATTGKQIDAIKLYKERVGCGLREAKDAIEALVQRASGL